ncbi:hypothetical protein BXP70_01125 [Hymenobacter crusticola]|uniref:Crp/Fnr family transcriptional regulator n=1 Tax=Hymenobacter crusticola TaxID=1770526 RepID=A0A243WKD6_9BACT|nr:hypothetical protein BXP70_01125 [Hymenobacter crusticola]
MYCQPEELEVIASSKVCQKYRKGQIIYQEGNPALGLYCVHSGKIKVIKVGGDYKEQIVHLGKEGEVLGLAALIASSSYSTSAVALDDCVVCFVPRISFLHLLSSNSQFCTSLLKVLADSLHKAEQGMVHLAYKPVRERLADALLLLLRTYQLTNQTQFSIAISRDDLAALVGTAKETTIRLLSEFKDEGIITSKGSQITILKPESLAEIAALYT